MAAFKSTTARLFVEFAKGFFEATSLADENPAVRKATIVYVTATQEQNKMENTSTELPQIKATLNAILNKLNEIGTPTTKQNYQLYSGQAAPIIKSIDETSLKHDTFQTRFQELRKETFDKVRAILAKIAKLSDPVMGANDQVSQNVLNGALQGLKDILTEYSLLERNSKRLQDSGIVLISNIHESLPGAVKAATPISENKSHLIQGG